MNHNDLSSYASIRSAALAFVKYLVNYRKDFTVIQMMNPNYFGLPLIMFMVVRPRSLTWKKVYLQNTTMLACGC